MLKKFFCMNLNTAGVVIGWVGAAYSFLMSILLMLFLIYHESIFADMGKNQPMMENYEFVIMTAVSIYLALNVINMTASVLLVAGTIKERHLMLTPWLINSGIYLMFSLLFALTLIASLINGNANANGNDDPTGALFILILNLCFQFYVWSAVYSLYKQYKVNTEQNPLVQPIQTKSPSYTQI